LLENLAGSALNTADYFFNEMNDSVIKEFNGINLFLTHVLLFLLNITCHFTE